MSGPVLALAATPRDWAQKLHRYVADHGGARIRGTVLTASEALAEHYEVLVADDRTSFLNQRLVRRLHDTGRLVIGLYEPQDPQGKSDLIEWEVDEARPSDLAPGELVAAAAALTLRRGAPALATPRAAPAAPAEVAPTGRAGTAQLVVVSGSRGAGRTEVALGLAAALAQDSGTILVELDEANASLGPRLGLPAYPNLRAAADWSRQGSAGAAAAVQRAEAGLGVLVAGPLPRALAPIPPDDLATVIGDLAALAPWLVVDVGESRGWTPPPDAHQVVTGTATPVGAFRLGAVLAGLPAPVHAVVNRAPASAFRRWEFLDELRRAHTPRSLTTVPDDRTVFDASWRGRPGTRGAFGKAMRQLAAQIQDGQEEVA